MRIIDIFAGLGGFHIALSDLGHEPIFASEKDITLQDIFTGNYMIKLGLVFEVLGFIMMMWQSVWKPDFKFIPSDRARNWIMDRSLGIACLLMAIGVILQIISLSQQ